MYSTELDVYKTVSSINTMKDPALRQIQIQDFNFLPSIEIWSLSGILPDEIKIDGIEDSIDYQKLKQFFDITLVVRERLNFTS